MIITVSREAYSNGSLIGQLVADELHYRVFDRELVDEMTRMMHVDPQVVERFDEATVNPVESVLLEWRASVNEQMYQRYLRRALHQIAVEGNAVVIGRGANFELSGPDVLHVRIIAPFALRTAIYRATHDVTAPVAEHAVHAEDAKRAHFIKQYYHHAVGDPELYDLTINLAHLTPEMAASLITGAAHRQAKLPRQPELLAILPQHIELMTRHRRPVRPGFVEARPVTKTQGGTPR